MGCCWGEQRQQLGNSSIPFSLSATVALSKANEGGGNEDLDGDGDEDGKKTLSGPSKHSGVEEVELFLTY